uniref:Ig-like domain-containing protein n=1 Tax=Acanthochromis polyacanthus TaxID=80966 RepID=A0A3Q1FC05_9TELE
MVCRCRSPPTFDSSLTEDVTVVRGNVASLLCIADGTPTPIISWLKDGVTLAPDRHLILLNLNTTLQIPQARVNDTGRYTCMANNTAGHASRHFNLKGSGVPAETQKYVAPVDSSVTLQCQADGSPPPSVTWHKDGQQLRESVRQRVLSSGSLQMAFIQPSDAGRYTCTAANAAGTDSLEMTPSIIIGTLGAPSIIVEPVETVVDAGTTSVLNCQAEGEPTPMIEWSRQGRPLLGNDRFSTLSNGSLRISSAQKEDTAEYECVARNLLGSVLVRVTLTVRGELDIVHFFLLENKYMSRCTTCQITKSINLIRLCNNPPPAFDGPQCEGTDTQTQVCKERPCPGKGITML